jgi:hypothetical protein
MTSERIKELREVADRHNERRLHECLDEIEMINSPHKCEDCAWLNGDWNCMNQDMPDITIFEVDVPWKCGHFKSKGAV